MLLRLLRRSGEVVQIGDVVTRLVAMRVVVPRKQLVELGFELCLAAFEFDESGNILRNKERVLPRQPFCDPAVGFSGVERRSPRAISMASTRKAGLRIDYVAPVLSTFAEESSIFLVPQ